MRKLLPLSLLSLSLVAFAQADPDPAAALAGAKTNIAARKYAAAADLLEPAIRTSAGIRDQAQQKQAMTALHFYAAVAYSGMARERDAMSHLQEALRLSPNLRSLDTTKYERGFVALFQRARTAVGTNTGRFDELYPGYSEASPVKDTAFSSMWESPAVEILGSRQEKRDWEAAVTPQAREKFMAAFWQERNGFRDAFSRRIGYADTAFELTGERGSMTDRGRVFAVLGPPAAVRRRPLQSGDTEGMIGFSRGSVGLEFGNVEYWIYNREQLPVSHPAPTVTFRFVTHQGVGEYVLQQDGVANHLLASAIRTPRD